ncbi:D-amino acid dehydrogenase [Rhodopseudomonas sp. NSM]|uniref:D-amino acid dehydrogenase n=1 Tax=Rhodopseudomonas sp. NSM TaxID=3457630 RepID=UPI00403655EA
MRVLVLGAGVVGVTTAYYLAKAGFEVTVIDRQPGPGLETSFANAGEVSPGYASPWAGPSVPRKAIQWMLDRHGPLVVRPQADPAMWRWIFQMLRNCTASRYALNKSRMVGVAEYSRDCLRALRADIGIAYDERSRGTLQLFRKQSQLDAIGGDVDILRQYNVPFEVLDRAGCIRAEPGLAAVQNAFVGGLRLIDDETGDCHLFTQRLEAVAAALGVKFVYETTIRSIDTQGSAVTGVTTDKGRFVADRYVMALGSFSPLLLRPLEVDIPVYPVKGYSITVPIVDEAISPQSTVMDESYKVAITRLGDRIRVGGTAEVGGYQPRLPLNRRVTLDRSLTDLFPGAGDLSKATFWSGLRPMTPDGPPIIGPTRFDNLHLNTGHGTLGWTMACGAARVVADQIQGREPEIDARALSMARYDQKIGPASWKHLPRS